MRSILPHILFILLISSLPLVAQEGTEDADDGVDRDTTSRIIVDATYVSCIDSTESIVILRSGRVVYALETLGISFKVFGPVLDELKRAMDTCSSIVETEGLDSCSTLGVILEGPKFILINTKKKDARTIGLFKAIERVRKMARKRLDPTMERMVRRIDVYNDSAVATLPSIAVDELRRQIDMSPVARGWKCRGSVFVTAKVEKSGKVLLAYVDEARVRGKCSALLSVVALRAILLSNFEPARRDNGKPIGSWVRIEVPFAGTR